MGKTLEVEDSPGMVCLVRCVFGEAYEILVELMNNQKLKKQKVQAKVCTKQKPKVLWPKQRPNIKVSK